MPATLPWMRSAIAASFRFPRSLAAVTSTAASIAALQAFHEHGIFTWVSPEPTLDVDASLAIVDETHEFVDPYKVGRVNYLPMTRTTD